MNIYVLHGTLSKYTGCVKDELIKMEYGLLDNGGMKKC